MAKYLKKLGYKYLLRVNEGDEVWATKSNKLASGEFRKSAKFDCFKTTTIEELAELSTYNLKVAYKL